MNEGIRKPWVRLPKTDPEILGVILGVGYGLLSVYTTRGFPDEHASPFQFFEDLYPEHSIWVGVLAVGIAILSGLYSYVLFLLFAPLFRPQMSDRRKPIFFRKMRVLYRCSFMLFLWSSLGIVAGLAGSVTLGMLGVYSDLPYRSMLYAMAVYLGSGIGGIRALDYGVHKRQPSKST